MILTLKPFRVQTKMKRQILEVEAPAGISVSLAELLLPCQFWGGKFHPGNSMARDKPR